MPRAMINMQTYGMKRESRYDKQLRDVSILNKTFFFRLLPPSKFICVHITFQKEINYPAKQVLGSWLAARKYFIILSSIGLDK